MRRAWRSSSARRRIRAIWCDDVTGEAAWTSVQVALHHACGRRGDSLWCWGADSDGQLARPYEHGTSKPIAILTTGWSAFAVVSDNEARGSSLGIRDGALFQWGNIATGDFSGSSVFILSQLGSATNWTAVAAGAATFMAGSEMGSLPRRCSCRCSGDTDNGQGGGVPWVRASASKLPATVAPPVVLACVS